MVLSSSSINVGMLLSHLLFALFLGAQMAQPLLYLSRFESSHLDLSTVASIRIPITIGAKTETDRQGT